jgi:ABC-type multidrug transport system permease subunit
MRNVFLVVKNNLYRISKDKTMLFMMIIGLPVIIYIAIYTSQLGGVKGQIAVVGGNYSQKEMVKKSLGNNGKLVLKFLEKSPTNTELIKGIYLEEIKFNKDKIKVTGFGNYDIKRSIEASMKGLHYAANKTETTTQGKIIGFLVMFSFIGAVYCMQLYVSDRENSIYSRVLSGRLAYYEYIIGQIMSTIIILTVPTIIMSTLVLKLSSTELSIGLGLFIILLMLVGILSSAFSMIVCTIFKKRETVEMGGVGIAMLTSILGGSFVNIVDNNKAIGFVRNFIPQKRIIDLANNYNANDLIYLVVVILVFIFISVFIGRKQYESGVFI